MRYYYRFTVFQLRDLGSVDGDLLLEFHFYRLSLSVIFGIGGTFVKFFLRVV